MSQQLYNMILSVAEGPMSREDLAHRLDGERNAVLHVRTILGGQAILCGEGTAELADLEKELAGREEVVHQTVLGYYVAPPHVARLVGYTLRIEELLPKEDFRLYIGADDFASEVIQLVLAGSTPLPFGEELPDEYWELFLNAEDRQGIRTVTRGRDKLDVEYLMGIRKVLCRFEDGLPLAAGAARILDSHYSLLEQEREARERLRQDAYARLRENSMRGPGFPGLFGGGLLN